MDDISKYTVVSSLENLPNGTNYCLLVNKKAYTANRSGSYSEVSYVEIQLFKNAEDQKNHLKYRTEIDGSKELPVAVCITKNLKVVTEVKSV